MRLWTRAIAAAAMLLALASPARAAWVEATSKHFVVYSDQSADEVRAFAQRLEKFDAAVRLVRSMSDPARSPATKVVVYVVPTIRDAQKLVGIEGAAGFYRAIVEGPMAVVPRERPSSDHEMDAQTILFHEYAHHLLLSDLDQPIPLWLSEGFAEFFATAEFNGDGSVKLGSAPEHRLMTFRYGPHLPLETMLSGETEGDQIYTLYALGWLLTHYLTFEESRRGQLQAFLADIAAGVEPGDAAKENFGNIRKLNAEVNGYLRRATRPALEIEPGVLKQAAVQVRQLPAGAAAVMPLRIESKSGVTKKEAPVVAAGVRRVAHRYPNDPMVLLTLAEAEIDADNAAASEAAADRLLAIEPRNVDAMVFKGRAIMARADAAGGDKSAAYDEARSWFIRANKIDKEDPEPLTYYYRSYKDQGIAPTANAAAAIHYASNLMPQDSSVRMLSVLQYARDGKTAEARETLVPLAYSGHQGGASDLIEDLMDKLEAGDAKGAVAIADEAEKKAKAEAES